MFLHENHDQSIQEDTYLNQNRIHEHYDCKFLTSLCDFMSVHENHDQPIWKSKISDIQEGWIMITMIHEFWHSFWLSMLLNDDHDRSFLKNIVRDSSWNHEHNDLIFLRKLLFLWFFYDYHDHLFRKMFYRAFLIYDAWWSPWSPMCWNIIKVFLFSARKLWSV